eukprot:jgi/Tetstr1/458283/TSEL_044769.t1
MLSLAPLDIKKSKRATGSGAPSADERPLVPAQAATETFTEYDEHAHDIYDTFTPVQWAKWLHDAADVRSIGWFRRTSLVLVSRELAHRDTIPRLINADRTAFFDYTSRILRLPEDDSDAHFMAARVKG